MNINPQNLFYLIDSDIWGPTRTPNLTNTWWFITFIDDHTRISWVFDRTLTLLIEFNNRTIGNSLITRFTSIAKNVYKQRKNKISLFEKASSLPRLLTKFSWSFLSPFPSPFTCNPHSVATMWVNISSLTKLDSFALESFFLFALVGPLLSCLW